MSGPIHPDTPSQTEVTDPIPPPDAREAALYRQFTALGITWTTHTHAPVFTVEEARVLGALPGTHTKNLFVTDRKDGLWLVSAREELRVDLNALAKSLGRPRFSFGAPELLADVLGVVPGAVSPFALMNDVRGRVRAVFDQGMLVPLIRSIFIRFATTGRPR